MFIEVNRYEGGFFMQFLNSKRQKSWKVISLNINENITYAVVTPVKNLNTKS